MSEGLEASDISLQKIKIHKLKRVLLKSWK
jgi:hypothetical protein